MRTTSAPAREPHPTTAPAPGAAPSREPLLALAVVAVATFLAYSNTLQAPFHFDDHGSIVQNESLRSLRGPFPASRWIGYFSFALNYRLGGLAPLGWHAVNLAIHVGCAFLVFALAAVTLRTPVLRRAEAGPLLRRFLPSLSALLFALHPLQTQAVTYVVQRFASLATLFFLLALVLYAKARLAFELEPRSRIRVATLLAVGTMAAAAAMRTKEIAFTLPFVAAGFELLLFRRRRLVLALPLAATALLVPLGHAGDASTLASALDDVGRLTAEAPEIPRWHYLLTQARVVATYLRMLVLPVGQNLDHDFPLSRSLAEPAVLGAIALLATVAGAAAVLGVQGRRSDRAPGVLLFLGVGWLFVTLAVESSVIPIHDVLFEHRMYLPSAGASIALATALVVALERLRLSVAPPLQAALLMAVVAGPLGVATYARNQVWRDPVTLWSDVVAKSPRKARARLNLGNAHLRRGEAEEAERQYVAALEIDPAQADALSNLGGAYLLQGRSDEAIPVLRRAAALAPSLAEAHENLGRALVDRGAVDEAIRELRTAIQLRPRSPAALANLGAAYNQVGRPDDAIAVLEKAIALDPIHAGARNNLGVALAAKGDLAAAERAFREALRLDPSSAEVRANLSRALGDGVAQARAHNELGSTRAAEGRLELAEREYREAIRLDPALAEAHTNLGVVLLRQGRASEAVHAHRRALALDGRPEIAFNLALALEASARPREAMAQYQRFLDQAGAKYPVRADKARASIARLRASMEPSR